MHSVSIETRGKIIAGMKTHRIKMLEQDRKIMTSAITTTRAMQAVAALADKSAQSQHVLVGDQVIVDTKADAKDRG